MLRLWFFFCFQFFFSISFFFFNVKRSSVSKPLLAIPFSLVYCLTICVAFYCFHVHNIITTNNDNSNNIYTVKKILYWNLSFIIHEVKRVRVYIDLVVFYSSFSVFRFLKWSAFSHQSMEKMNRSFFPVSLISLFALFDKLCLHILHIHPK